mmetsp:Transcript_21975/g.36810  ORF Transcript_21975/g.36810 Transcript_21975/m.36810 type:complete len:296 (+) Transcript_21975:28-915(+)
MKDIFQIANVDTFLKRSYRLLWVCPEAFMCGFLWQGFSFTTAGNSDTAGYYFTTGFGSGLGAFMGHMVTNINVEDGVPMIDRMEIFHSIAFFMAIFIGSGTTWQKIVNDTRSYDMNFTQAFFYMWLVSFLLFGTVLTLLRFLHTSWLIHIRHKETWDDIQSVSQRFYYDLQIASAVGLADAFFVGTVSGIYNDNWLGGAFGTTESTPVFESMVKAGASTMIGFVVCQTVFNAVLKYNWVDPIEDDKGVGKRGESGNMELSTNSTAALATAVSAAEEGQASKQQANSPFHSSNATK